MSQKPQITLQQAYERECVLIAEAYSTIHSIRKKLKLAMERRNELVGQIAQANFAAQNVVPPEALAALANTEEVKKNDK